MASACGGPRRRRTPALLVVTAGLALAACGSVTAGSTSTTREPTRPLATQAAAPIRHVDRPTLARREARLLLRQFRPAADWRRYSSPPPGSGTLLRTASEVPGSPNLVDLHRFYVAPTTASGALDWVKSHLPTGSRLAGGESSGNVNTGNDLWGVALAWSTSDTIFDSAGLLVAAVDLPGGRSGVRVDSQVVWLPAKNRADFVPSSVTSVTATVPSSHVRPVTSTDPRVIDELRRAIAALPVMPAGTFSCPADFGGDTIRLSFGETGQSAPVAVVLADLYGCGSVSITVRGRSGTELWGGARIVHLSERLLGIHLHVRP